MRVILILHLVSAGVLLVGAVTLDAATIVDWGGNYGHPPFQKLRLRGSRGVAEFQDHSVDVDGNPSTVDTIAYFPFSLDQPLTHLSRTPVRIAATAGLAARSMAVPPPMSPTVPTLGCANPISCWTARTRESLTRVTMQSLSAPAIHMPIPTVSRSSIGRLCSGKRRTF